jgi:GNAT superfamily N-acetyltransferase
MWEHPSMGAICVRTADATDGPAVRDLILAGLAQRWGTLDATRTRDLDDLTAAHPGSLTVVVLDDDVVVATGTVVPRADRRAEVVRMSVASGRRRAGLGRRVLDELTSVATGWSCTHLVLETTATWLDAVEFYERNGFRRTHQSDDGNGGIDVWFERPLC